MKQTALRFIAMCLAMLMVLTACGPATTDTTPTQQPTEQLAASTPTNPAGNPTDPTNPTDPVTPTEPSEPTEPTEPTESTTAPTYVAFADMEYSRQDADELDNYYQIVLDSIEAEDDVDTLLEKIHEFYDAYCNYYTGYALANIYYSKDLTDSYWEEEYNYFMDTSSDVDAIFDQMLHDLAKCPLADALEEDEFFGEGFFDDYQGESIWDETFTALMAREAELLAQYYQISGDAVNVAPGTELYYNTYGSQMADVFVEMIKVRQQIAEYAGYPDYASFAYDFTYGRDYTPDQAAKLMADIKTYITPLYISFNYNEVVAIANKSVNSTQALAYVKSCAQSMGGVMMDAYNAMRSAGLYDITPSSKKYNASFEIFIHNYGVPYVFVNPTQKSQDKLTFVHEFGHFANDFASNGSSVGIDVAEFFSQGLEFLSLRYSNGGGELTKLQIFSSLSVYVEQSLYATFEQRVYELKGDELTKENVYKVFEDVAREFGFGNLDGRMFVQVPHFFMSPMYIISYVVSNDLAVQLYQVELAERGAGVTLYLENLDTTEGQLLGFAASAGLESPFADGRMATVRDTFSEALR